MQSVLPLVHTVANELIPSVGSYLKSAINYLFRPRSTQLTIVVDEFCGMVRNEVFEAAEIYLRTKISPSTRRRKVFKTPRQKEFKLGIVKNTEITDAFEGFHLKWTLLSCIVKNTETTGKVSERRFFELRFHMKFNHKVLTEYLPFVVAKSNEITDSEKIVKLYATVSNGGRSINLDHPATFDTLAMDPDIKKFILEDLDRFVKGKEYYKKVGKAWKRGYLLYGPPGTGKSSLIAAMANHLKYDIYDVELNSLRSNSAFRNTLLSTKNRSMIVIEDIDCSTERPNEQWTLSGLLNFIDGLWSSHGDERIIVFTTNHKDRLEPALLRPGRMDVHIHMTYCTNHGFMYLALNYLDIKDHLLFNEIKDLIEKVEITPAEVAGELMTSDNADIALDGLVHCLKRKMIEANDVNEDDTAGPEAKRLKIEKPERRPLRNCRKSATKG